MISVIPGDMLATNPYEVIVATPGVALLHMPPPMALARMVVPPLHIVVIPVIGASGFINILFVTRQYPKVYVIVTEPAETVVTNPEDIVAIAGLLLLHIPPGKDSPKTNSALWHTTDAPVMADGVGFMVTTVPVKQPPGSV